jgi:hypothetical protein
MFVYFAACSVIAAAAVTMFQTPALAASPGNQSRAETTVPAMSASVTAQQLDAYRRKLSESEILLQAFQQRHGIVSILDQQRLLLEQRKDRDTALKNLENYASGLEQKLGWLKEQMKVVPRDIPLTNVSERQKVIDEAKGNLLGLKLREEQLLINYVDTSRVVQSIRKELRIAERFIQEQEAALFNTVTKGPNPVYQDLETETMKTEASLIAASKEKEIAARQVNDIETELGRLVQVGIQWDELQRQRTADEHNYTEYLHRVGTAPGTDYRIQVGDQIDIKFFYNPELNEQITVRPDGRIGLQLVGELVTAGMTAGELKAVLVSKYAEQLRDPEVAVIVRSFSVPVEQSAISVQGVAAR